jgi:hypothetical protein
MISLDAQGWGLGRAVAPAAMLGACDGPCMKVAEIISVVDVGPAEAGAPAVLNLCRHCTVQFLMSRWPHLNEQGALEHAPIKVKVGEHPKFKMEG